MRIIQVVVEIHEKRNHPFEFGHYDAGVRLVADLTDSMGTIGDMGAAIHRLQDTARQYVLEELDNWEGSIRQNERIKKLTNEIRHAIQFWSWRTQAEIEANKATITGLILELPEGMRGEFYDMLDKKVDAAITCGKYIDEEPLPF